MISSKLTYFFLCFISVLLFSCSSKTKSISDDEIPVASNSGTIKEEIVEQNIDEKTTVKADTNVNLVWKFSTTEDADFNPITDINIEVGGKVVEIAKAAMGNFDEIEKSQYKDDGIPESAVTACKGFWAGLLQVIYIEKSENTLKVMEGFLDEGQEELKFEEVKKIDLSK